MDPLNLAAKHDEYLAPSWRKPEVLLDSAPEPGQLGTNWRDSLSFEKLLHFTSYRGRLQLTASISSKLLAVPDLPPVPDPLQCRAASDAVPRDISQ